MARRWLRVVAALFEQDGEGPRRYLVQQRNSREARALLWEFPGGKVEAGEGDRDALMRELKEELGVLAKVEWHLDEVKHSYPDLDLDLALYRCSLLSGDPAPLHAEKLSWVTGPELSALPFTEADVPFVAKLQAGAYEALR